MSLLQASSQGRKGSGDHRCTGFPAACFISSSSATFGPPTHPEYAVAYTVHHGNANPLNSTQVLTSEGSALLSLPISPSAYNLSPNSSSPNPLFSSSSSSSSSIGSPQVGPSETNGRRSTMSFSSRSALSTLQIPTNQTENTTLFSPVSGGSLYDDPNLQRDLERKGLLNAAVRAMASLKDVHGNRACVHLCTDSQWLVRIINEEVPRWEKEGWPDIKKHDLEDVEEGLDWNESDEISSSVGTRGEKPPTPTTDSGVALAKALARRKESSEDSSNNGAVIPKTSAAQRLAQAVSAGNVNSNATSPTSTAASSPRKNSIPLHDSVRRNSTLGSKSIQFDSNQKSSLRNSKSISGGIGSIGSAGKQTTSILNTTPSNFSLSLSYKSNFTSEERDFNLLKSLGSDFVLLRSLIQLIDFLKSRSYHTGGFKLYLIEGNRNPAREKSRQRAKVEAEEREYKRKGQISTLKKPTTFEADTNTTSPRSVKSAKSVKSVRSINSISVKSETNNVDLSNESGNGNQRSLSIKSKSKSFTRSPLLGQELSNRNSIAENAFAPRLRTYSSKSANSKSGATPIVHRNSSLAPALPLSTSGLLLRTTSNRSGQSQISNSTEKKSEIVLEKPDVPKDLIETDVILRPVSVQRTKSGDSFESARSNRTTNGEGEGGKGSKEFQENVSIENEIESVSSIPEPEPLKEEEEVKERDEIRSSMIPLENERIKFPKFSKKNPSNNRNRNHSEKNYLQNYNDNNNNNNNGGILKKNIKQKPAPEDEMFKKEKKSLFGGMFGNWRIMA